MNTDAQLTPPIEAVCPGNDIVFICQQIGSVSRWTITMPGRTLQRSVGSSQVGAVVTFENDPIHFEILVIAFNSSNIITSELQVTAIRQLNGVTVECAGLSGTFTSTIQVASVGELIMLSIIIVSA